jgi:hypothetical protein
MHCGAQMAASFASRKILSPAGVRARKIAMRSQVIYGEIVSFIAVLTS